MRGSRFSQAPPLPLVVAVLVSLGILLGREASVKEDLPVFLPIVPGKVHVELAGDELPPGVHQYNDGMTPCGVIKLTMSSPVENLSAMPSCLEPLRDGERLTIKKNDRQIASLERGWMTASHRMALGIPLHPDRMAWSDWQALPDVGEVLASVIEQDRQKNGDFGSLQAMLRVRGIGEKRLNAWKEFF